MVTSICLPIHYIKSSLLSGITQKFRSSLPVEKYLSCNAFFPIVWLVEFLKSIDDHKYINLIYKNQIVVKERIYS